MPAETLHMRLCESLSASTLNKKDEHALHLPAHLTQGHSTPLLAFLRHGAFHDRKGQNFSMFFSDRVKQLLAAALALVLVLLLLHMAGAVQRV